MVTSSGDPSRVVSPRQVTPPGPTCQGPLTARRPLSQHRPAMLAYVGAYTSKDRNGRGDGINVYRIDEVAGSWSHVQRLGDLVNPSWLLLDRRRPVLYAAHGEGHE